MRASYLHRSHDEIRNPSDDEHESHPLIEAQTATLFRRIDSEAFDPQPSDAVSEDVDGEESFRVALFVPRSTDQNEGSGESEIPQ